MKQYIVDAFTNTYQVSKRGGHLYCEMLENGRIAISGEATLVAVSEIIV